MDIQKLIESQRESRRRHDQRENSLRGQFPMQTAVTEALEDLEYRRRSMFEAPPLSTREMLRFAEAHPEEAGAGGLRQDAAEYLYRLVRLLNGHTLLETDEVLNFFRRSPASKAIKIETLLLDRLHAALFDRDAAVRLTIVETLALLARPESVPFLEQLSQCEDESTLIPTAVVRALDCCQNGKPTDIRDHLSAVRETLNADVVDCWLALRQADRQVHRRNFVRAVFAAIEGFVSVMKADVIKQCYAGRFKPSRAEAALLFEEAYEAAESGQPRVRPSFVPTQSNVRFAFAVFAKAHGLSAHADYSSRSWQAVREGIQVRNRITHPKAEADLSVSDYEIKLVDEAYAWFLDATFTVNARGKDEMLGLLETARRIQPE